MLGKVSSFSAGLIKIAISEPAFHHVGVAQKRELFCVTLSSTNFHIGL